MADCSPDALMAAAKCLRCVPAGELAGVKTWELCQWANRPTRACLTQANIYLNDWLARVAVNQAAFGAPVVTPSTQNQDAIREFLCACIENGLDTKAYSVCVFPPSTPADYAAAATPVLGIPAAINMWRYYSLGGVLLNNATVTNNFTMQITGLSSVGTVSSGYLKTAVNFQAIGNDFTALAVQLPILLGTGWTTGANTVAGESTLIHNVGNRHFYRSYSGLAAGDIDVPTGGVSACFLCGARRSATDFAFYKGVGGALNVLGSKNTSNGTAPNLEHYLFARNNTVDGNATDFLQAQAAFAGYFGVLQQTQIEALYTAVNVMRVSMGGGNI